MVLCDASVVCVVRASCRTGDEFACGAFMAGFGERFRAKRKSLGIAMRDASSRVGITEDQLGRIERDESGVSLPTLVKMAEVYECEVADLFENHGVGELRAAIRGLPDDVGEAIIKMATEHAKLAKKIREPEK